MPFPATLPPFDAPPRERAMTWSHRVSGVSDLVRMWGHPRMLLWFAIGVAGLVAVRWPFGAASFIPGCVEFHPGFVLAPFLGAVWGPAGCWAALVSSLLGERWADLSEVMGWGRAAGLFLAARCGQRLLGMGEDVAAGPLGLFDGLRAVPAACAMALCMAMAAAVLHYSPMVHVLALTLANNLFFLGLFLPALSPTVRRRCAGGTRTWQAVLHRPGGWKSQPRAGLLIWTGALGGCAGLILASGWGEALWPWSLYLIGVRTGPGLMALAALSVGLLVVGVFWPVGGKVEPGRMN